MSVKRLSVDDFSNPAAITQKILLKLDVRVPVPLIHAAGEDIAAGRQAKDAAPPGKVIDEMLAKLAEESYIRIDKGVAQATLVMQDAKLTMGGKPVQLPPQASPVANPAPPADLPAQQYAGIDLTQYQRAPPT